MAEAASPRFSRYRRWLPYTSSGELTPRRKDAMDRIREWIARRLVTAAGWLWPEGTAIEKRLRGLGTAVRGSGRWEACYHCGSVYQTGELIVHQSWCQPWTEKPRRLSRPWEEAVKGKQP